MLLGRATIVIDSDWYEPTTNSEDDKAAAETKIQFVVSLVQIACLFKVVGQ